MTGSANQLKYSQIEETLAVRFSLISRVKEIVDLLDRNKDDEFHAEPWTGNGWTILNFAKR